MTYDLDDPDVDELRAEARQARAFSHALARHPDCRDPEHPGCELCEGDGDAA